MAKRSIKVYENKIKIKVFILKKSKQTKKSSQNMITTLYAIFSINAYITSSSSSFCPSSCLGSLGMGLSKHYPLDHYVKQLYEQT